MDVLQLRITNIDWSLVRAGPLDNTRFARCPVIRVFGATSTGDKACVHIHQTLNRAIAISLKRNPLESKFVRAVILVKGVHFYGFHSSYAPFLKVIMADPGMVQRAATVLRSGAVMRQKIQVFETHISFILQFMCDFGLYGCGWLDFGRYYVREGGKDSGLKCQFSKSPHTRVSRMSLEIDIISHQILNRHKLVQRNLHHTLTIPRPIPSSSEPLVQSVRELWDIERARRTALGLNPTPELPVDASAGQRGLGGGWEQEPLFWEQFRARTRRNVSDDKQPPEPDTSQGWEKWVMTAFESIEALWEEDWKTWVPQLSGAGKPIAGEQPATQTAREANPFVMTQIDQETADHPGEREDHKLHEVDEDLATGQAFQRLVTAAEEAQYYEDDERWDDLLYDDALREMGTQNTNRGVSVPATPTKRQRTRTPMSSPRRTNPFSTPESVRSRSNSYVSPSTTPTRKVVVKYASLSCWLLYADPVMQRLTLQPVAPIAFNPTPVARARKNVDEKTPIFEEDNPFLDAATTRPTEAEPQRLDETELLRAPKRQKLTQDYQPTQYTPAPVAQKVMRWADIGEQSPLPTPSFFHQPAPIRGTAYEYNRRPPTKRELLDSLAAYGLPSKIRRAGVSYQGWDGCRVIGGLEVKGYKPVRPVYAGIGVNGWEYAGGQPPSVSTVRRWLDSAPGQDGGKEKRRWRPNPNRSQLEGPTQNTHGFKVTQKKTEGGGGREKQMISALSVEIFACTRGELLPNPSEDGITCLFYCFSDAGGDAEDRADYQTGCIVVSSIANPRWIPGYKTEVVETELDLLNSLVDMVRDWDPDILAGWQVQTLSWGYIDARGRNYGLEISEEMARVSNNHGRKAGSERWDETHGSSFHVVGRHVLNVWRIMRSEQALEQYTYENVVFHVMHKRMPRYSDMTLTEWFRSGVPSRVARLLNYWADRTATVLDLLDQTEVILRTAESARIIGVDFMSVLTRGSQFKVESIMFKIAKQENFIMISPSKEQVGSQNACECLPLVMEPESAFYTPLVVLDFQSLYPSIMIAYNYCYSTFLGRAALFQGKNKFGVTELDLPPGLLEKIGEENIHIAANGMAYAKRNVREGLLGRMLTELLETRIMIKQAMKSARGDRGLSKILNARQLSLKFICNVTYGYTSANFSGRMPAAEIADSIVQSGRETLEKAIAVIEQTPKWGARVVYGDTDSLFVHLPGRTKEEAFRLGNEIADTITATNPPPIKLKFEKASLNVYYPCVLMAKKRYVGFKYENPDEIEPVFDAKGIETVRRDGIPAGQKMVEKCLKILFRTQDFSEVKDYCVSSWTKIMKGQVSVQDFIFAKEVRLGGYSDKVPPPPGATVAAKKLALDPMAEPQYGDRVPYVIIRGEPGSRLVDRAVPPEELLRDRCALLIPADRKRIFNLVGTNVRQWFENMPKPIRAGASRFNNGIEDDEEDENEDDRQNIDEHFKSMQCMTFAKIVSKTDTSLHNYFWKNAKTRTFKPRKDVPEGTKQYQLRKYAEATLGSGNLRLAVILPEGEDLNEWLAVHTVDFFNHLNMLYGTVTEFCTPQQCPIMSAGPRYEYLWEDGVTYKRPTKLSAPEYVDALMNWVQGLLDDEKVFPNKIGVPFPRNFQSTVKTLVRRLFRVYAHLYSHHFEQIAALGIEAHLNTSYRHFFLFINEFDLVDKKELVPLDELNEAILAEDKGR
ncbi:DNA polymerase family B [Ceratobasidium sp. AG-Ba]|nr:DNA polymerase family B [Ceratobasidium sp. AG-Ba]